MRVTRDELEALKRACFQLQELSKLAVRGAAFRQGGGVQSWNEACSRITSIVRNIEATDEPIIEAPTSLRSIMREAAGE